MAILAANFFGCASTARVHEQRIELPEGMQKLAVDVENFWGEVELRADRGREGAAFVRAHVVTAWDADKERRAEVGERVEVDAYIEEQAPGMAVLRVRTDKQIRGHEHGVRLYIEVPRADGTRIVNEGGFVEVVGVRGATYIENRFGMIELRTDHPLTENLTILNTDGAIWVRIPPGSTGAFDLQTMEGESVLRDVSGDAGEVYATGPIFRTTLGDGTNRVLARTNSGDIRVSVMEHPQAYSRLVKRTMPSVTDGMFLEGSRRSTRNLPDDAERENPATFQGRRP